MTRRLLVLAAVLLTWAVSPVQAAWLVGANAGLGIPAGNMGDLFGNGLLLGASVGYLSAPFEIGVDASWMQNDASGDYEQELALIDAQDQAEFLQYGVHARWMAPTQSALSPYLGLGLGGYKISESYEEPGLVDEPSETVLGVNVRGGVNYWIHQAWGVGADLSYHVAWLDEEESPFPEAFGSSARFIGIALGVRWRTTEPH